jgi:hypothetical protein
LERLWKEAVAILSQHLLGRTEKIYGNPQYSSFPSVIITKQLPNVSLQLGCFYCVLPLRFLATLHSASVYLSIDLGCFFSFLLLYIVGRTPWTGDQPVTWSLPTHRTTQTQNKRTQTSMPQVGFEPTTPVFERAKSVHALDRASTVIGLHSACIVLYCIPVASIFVGA